MRVSGSIIILIFASLKLALVISKFRLRLFFIHRIHIRSNYVSIQLSGNLCLHRLQIRCLCQLLLIYHICILLLLILHSHLVLLLRHHLCIEKSHILIPYWHYIIHWLYYLWRNQGIYLYIFLTKFKSWIHCF